MSVETPSNITPLFSDDEGPTRTPPRLRKLRLVAILIPLSLLAVVSTLFGMMMAVASDLPDLENAREFQSARNSVLVDLRGRQLGVLTNNHSRILVSYGQIAPTVRNAVIAIEDRRFYENPGVDLRGIARALVQDIIHQQAVQGGSTITQQFVKNALRAQNDRTIFQKMREAALAYHLTRRWSKSKILTQYLNSIYFGNGAYGIEAAARTYFGREPGHEGCGTRVRPCAAELKPWEAALLAGIIASPGTFDPVAHPAAARARRDLVLERMYEQGRLSRLDLFNDRLMALPAPDEVQPPRVESKAPYFATWVRQQLVDRFGARRALEGGLTVQTTLDLDLQRAAEHAVGQYLGGPTLPSAALVAIDNDTGAVRAMIGGRDYHSQPFNLATQGRRQPGSSIKPFILAEALTRGISPASVWPSRKRAFPVPHSHGRDQFVVHNFEDSYAGANTLARALTVSDNAVFAAVGIHVGTRRVARMARRMGIRTRISTNYAMTLGGLRRGVTPLDMAHAYETFASGGERVSGTLGTSQDGPVGIRAVTSQGRKPRVIASNRVRRRRVLRPDVARTATQILSSVVQYGTGRRASLGTIFAAGKTGTTENSGDAWFVGFTKRLTVAVWVGYPQGLKPMRTEFAGGPVEGGTFPALIWRAFMVQAEGIYQARANAARAKRGLPPLPAAPAAPAATAASVPPEGSQSTPSAPPPAAAPAAAAPASSAPAAPATSAPAAPATSAPAAPTSSGPAADGQTSAPAEAGSPDPTPTTTAPDSAPTAPADQQQQPEQQQPEQQQPEQQQPEQQQQQAQPQQQSQSPAPAPTTTPGDATPPPTGTTSSGAGTAATGGAGTATTAPPTP